MNDVSVKFSIFALGDLMAVHRLMGFFTHDRDQNVACGNCAEICKGAWWYSRCHSANPNGLYLGGATDQYATGITLSSHRGQHNSMKIMEIKIRKNND